ncbi:MAG: SagB/ThcOx family dehydrogenase [Chloroflexi bacterium]|nr:SagB/ThcOx family dehydrogenase [Chloroflexota bacterium]
MSQPARRSQSPSTGVRRRSNALDMSTPGSPITLRESARTEWTSISRTRAGRRRAAGAWQVTGANARTAREYHEATKHSLESIRSGRHSLEWANQPRTHKLYNPDLERIALPRAYVPPHVPAITAVSPIEAPRDGVRIPDLSTLATLLHYSAGITKHLRHPSGAMPFRAASCTGALYHIELYVVCGELPGLAAGVYQYGVHDEGLRAVRRGDYRGVLVQGTADEAAVANAPVVIVCTSTFWRNAWKYEARAYRHSFWDSGTILANMLAIAAGHDLPARIVLGYVDEAVNRLVGVDGEREAAISLVALGHAPGMRPSTAPIVESIDLPTVPSSPREVDYPIIRAAHAASGLTTPDEVAEWRRTAEARPLGAPPAPDTGKTIVPLRSVPAADLPHEPIEAVIQRRGSARQFEPSPVSFEVLSTVLEAATAGNPLDILGAFPGTLNDAYLIVNAVDGLESGTYLLNRERRALEQLRAADFRREAGFLDLGQQLGADAAINVYFLADLESLFDRFGDRGYRAAQLDASIMAGKLYLAAYALRVGATGLTFFDDDVTRFFSPHAQGKSVMFLIALGNPARRRPI